MYEYSPKVSIVIPAYKASNYLAEAIESALAQTYENIEIIVVNDGSPDDGATRAVAEKYIDKIRYFEKENGGSSSALNRGIAEMQGEWFSWLSHDDLYEPKKVERQIEELNKLYAEGEDVTNHIFFSAHRLINGEGKKLQESSNSSLNKTALRISSVKGNEYLVAEPTNNNFHGCSCLVHKSVFERLGGFNESLRLLNDVDLWYRLYIGGCVVHYIPEVLVIGRVHSAQVSTSIGYSYHNPEQDMFWNRSLDWLLKNHPNNYELFVMYGKNAYRKTRYAEGDRAFAQAKKLKKSGALWFKKCICKTEGHLLSIGKKVYLKLMKK